jgi:hypothetical protein
MAEQVITVAVGDQRARVLYRLPEQRRWLGSAGTPGLLQVVLALVLFAGGLAVGRATMTRQPAAGGQAAPTATSAPAATAGAPAAQAATPQAATAVGKAGPRRLQHGVPVGYAHNDAGAVAAATNYVTVLSSSIILDRDKRHAAIGVVAAPEARARLQRTFDQAVASLAKGLGVPAGAVDDGKVVLRAIPVGWRLERYDDRRARVAIWATGVAGTLAGVPVQEGWGTTTVNLRWVGGDWKQLDTKTTDGPVPIADPATPTAPSELIPKAQEFKEYTYAPGS